MVTDSGDYVVLAMQRRGEDLGPAASRLASATRCWSRAPGKRSTEIVVDPDVLVVDQPAWCAARRFLSVRSRRRPS